MSFSSFDIDPDAFRAWLWQHKDDVFLRVDGNQCPLARYLQEYAGRPMTVGMERVAFAGDNVVFPGACSVPLPDWAAEFVVRLDNTCDQEAWEKTGDVFAIRGTVALDVLDSVLADVLTGVPI